MEETLVLSNLPRLSWLGLDSELYVGELLQLEYLCSLPADSVSAPASAALKTIGCCTEQRTDCEGDLQCHCAAPAR